MLQDTVGFGEPSASQIKTLCLPSSPRCLDRSRITGAPATGRNTSDTSEWEDGAFLGRHLFKVIQRSHQFQKYSHPLSFVSHKICTILVCESDTWSGFQETKSYIAGTVGSMTICSSVILFWSSTVLYGALWVIIKPWWWDHCRLIHPLEYCIV